MVSGGRKRDQIESMQYILGGSRRFLAQPPQPTIPIVIKSRLNSVIFSLVIFSRISS